MAISKSKLCNECLNFHMKFSGEEGDYGYTVSEFLDTKAEEFDDLLGNFASSNFLYGQLLRQGGPGIYCGCIHRLSKKIPDDVLPVANEALRQDPAAKKRLVEFEQYVKNKKKQARQAEEDAKKAREEEQKNEARSAYNVYVREKNTASSLAAFKKLKEKFELMGDFQDARRLARECKDEINRIEAEEKRKADEERKKREAEEKKNAYSKAKGKLDQLNRRSGQTLEELEELKTAYFRVAEKFNMLTGHEDSAQLMRQSRAKAEEYDKRCNQIKEERERQAEEERQAKKRLSSILLLVQIALFALFLYVLFMTEIAFPWRGPDVWGI